MREGHSVRCPHVVGAVDNSKHGKCGRCLCLCGCVCHACIHVKSGCVWAEDSHKGTAGLLLGQANVTYGAPQTVGAHPGRCMQSCRSGDLCGVVSATVTGPLTKNAYIVIELDLRPEVRPNYYNAYNGGDLQPGYLADRLVAGHSQPEINP
eukprot:1158368-Pelagomonas_calceolata.AAC.12